MARKSKSNIADAFFLFQDYTKAIIKVCDKLQTPSVEDLDTLKGLLDNVNLWMETLEEEVRAERKAMFK